MNLGVYVYAITFRKGTTPDKETQLAMVEDLKTAVERVDTINKLKINTIVKSVVRTYDTGNDSGICNISVLSITSKVKYVTVFKNDTNHIKVRLTMLPESEDKLYFMVMHAICDDNMIIPFRCIGVCNEPDHEAYFSCKEGMGRQKENDYTMFHCINSVPLTSYFTGIKKTEPAEVTELVKDSTNNNALSLDVRKYIHQELDKFHKSEADIEIELNIMSHKLRDPRRMRFGELRSIIAYFDKLERGER